MRTATSITQRHAASSPASTPAFPHADSPRAKRPLLKARRSVGVLALIAAALGGGCKENGQPPAPAANASASNAGSAAVSVSARASGEGASRARASGEGASSASSAPATSSSAIGSNAPVPELLGPDGKPLPQTKDKPSLRSASYEKRIALLWDAIVKDDATIAGPAFFPLVAYQQVKAIPNPTADWTERLMKAFVRDIHWAHEQLGPGAASAQLVGLEVHEDKAQWMEPGREGNKLGYWRALGSKLRWLDGGGAPKSLELTSLISWRGEWYVVHVHGFK